MRSLTNKEIIYFVTLPQHIQLFFIPSSNIFQWPIRSPTRAQIIVHLYCRDCPTHCRACHPMTHVIEAWHELLRCMKWILFPRRFICIKWIVPTSIQTGADIVVFPNVGHLRYLLLPWVALKELVQWTLYRVASGVFAATIAWVVLKWLSWDLWGWVVKYHKVNYYCLLNLSSGLIFSLLMTILDIACHTPMCACTIVVYSCMTLTFNGCKNAL